MPRKAKVNAAGNSTSSGAGVRKKKKHRSSSDDDDGFLEDFIEMDQPKDKKGVGTSSSSSRKSSRKPAARRRLAYDDGKDRGGDSGYDSESSGFGSYHASDSEDGLGSWTWEDRHQVFSETNHLNEGAGVEAEDGGLEYAVEAILSWRRHPRRGHPQFRTLWSGFPIYVSSWEPEQNFGGDGNQLEEFWERTGGRPDDCPKPGDGDKTPSVHSSTDTEFLRKGSDIELATQAKKRIVRQIRKDKVDRRKFWQWMRNKEKQEAAATKAESKKQKKVSNLDMTQMTEAERKEAKRKEKRKKEKKEKKRKEKEQGNKLKLKKQKDKSKSLTPQSDAEDSDRSDSSVPLSKTQQKRRKINSQVIALPDDDDDDDDQPLRQNKEKDQPLHHDDDDDAMDDLWNAPPGASQASSSIHSSTPASPQKQVNTSKDAAIQQGAAKDTPMNGSSAKESTAPEAPERDKTDSNSSASPTSPTIPSSSATPATATMTERGANSSPRLATSTTTPATRQPPLSKASLESLRRLSTTAASGKNAPATTSNKTTSSVPPSDKSTTSVTTPVTASAPTSATTKAPPPSSSASAAATSFLDSIRPPPPSSSTTRGSFRGAHKNRKQTQFLDSSSPALNAAVTKRGGPTGRRITLRIGNQPTTQHNGSAANAMQKAVAPHTPTTLSAMASLSVNPSNKSSTDTIPSSSQNTQPAQKEGPPPQSETSVVPNHQSSSGSVDMDLDSDTIPPPAQPSSATASNAIPVRPIQPTSAIPTAPRAFQNGPSRQPQQHYPHRSATFTQTHTDPVARSSGESLPPWARNSKAGKPPPWVLKAHSQQQQQQRPHSGGMIPQGHDPRRPPQQQQQQHQAFIPMPEQMTSVYDPNRDPRRRK
ncbi:unnamed protein product [Sympodiomycopsis kandeliae]